MRINWEWQFANQRSMISLCQSSKCHSCWIICFQSTDIRHGKRFKSTSWFLFSERTSVIQFLSASSNPSLVMALNCWSSVVLAWSSTWEVYILIYLVLVFEGFEGSRSSWCLRWHNLRSRTRARRLRQNVTDRELSCPNYNKPERAISPVEFRPTIHGVLFKFSFWKLSLPEIGGAQTFPHCDYGGTVAGLRPSSCTTVGCQSRYENSFKPTFQTGNLIFL